MTAVKPGRPVPPPQEEQDTPPPDLVRMAHDRLGVREVPRSAVNKMKRNGWRLDEASRPKARRTKNTEEEGSS